MRSKPFTQKKKQEQKLSINEPMFLVILASTVGKPGIDNLFSKIM